MSAGSSMAASHTPVRPSRAPMVSRAACHTASGTMTSPVAGSDGSAPSAPSSSSCQLSAASFRSLMSAIDVFLERFHSDAANHVDEALGFAVAVFQIDVHELLDHVGDFVLRHRRTE